MIAHQVALAFDALMTAPSGRNRAFAPLASQRWVTGDNFGSWTPSPTADRSSTSPPARTPGGPTPREAALPPQSNAGPQRESSRLRRTKRSKCCCKQGSRGLFAASCLNVPIASSHCGRAQILFCEAASFWTQPSFACPSTAGVRPCRYCGQIHVSLHILLGLGSRSS